MANDTCNDDKLPEKERAVLALIKDNDCITLQEIADSLKVSKRTATRIVSSLKSKGKLRRSGESTEETPPMEEVKALAFMDKDGAKVKAVALKFAPICMVVKSMPLPLSSRYMTRKGITFLFLNEFDAFYSYELRRKIIELRNKERVQ